MNLTIRKETPEDIPVIDAVTIAAFLEAPHTSHTEQFIVKALRDSGVLTLSLVAEVNGAVVGHVAASPVSIADGTLGWFGLGPISVIPEYQKCGIGSQLMIEALNTLKQNGAGGCVLLGDPEYYKRFGFKSEARLILPGVPPEYFQAMCFKKPVPQGIVTYHEAFDVQG